jgi:hypothetical protein
VGFTFLASLRRALSGAVVALLLYILGFEEGRDHGGSTGEMADAAQDDFGAAVVEFYISVNLDELAAEAADVAGGCGGETMVSGVARCRALPGRTAEGGCPHMGSEGVEGTCDLH